MKLKKILKKLPEIDVKGQKDIEITGVCSNSKIVFPGNLFIAKAGLKTDGSKYIPEAIEGGATAILTDMYDPTYKSVTQIIVDDVSAVEAAIVSEYFENPSQQLKMVGITGTNGKTTVAYLVKHVIEHTSGPCGLIGTIEYLIGEHSRPATHTTPDITQVHKILHEMVQHGCHAAAMEVTSHALEQGRVGNVDFDIAVFTNLSQDHLDYHVTMEHYCQAKNKLFREMKNGICVVNVDDPYMESVTHGCTCDMLTYGIESKADVRATNIQYDKNVTHFNVEFQEKSYSCSIPLLGKYSVYNALAAIGVGLAQGIIIERLIEIAQTFPSVAGRLESIDNDLGIKLFIDFAHTEDALKNVLLCLKEMSNGKMITVFGCGGDRDRTKRPRMAQAAEALSDYVIVTSDNPRSEDPQRIIDDVSTGFSNVDCFEVVIDRKEAIARAIERAKPGDTVLIAGRGHEAMQVFAQHTIEFSDALIAKAVCE